MSQDRVRGTVFRPLCDRSPATDSFGDICLKLRLFRVQKPRRILTWTFFTIQIHLLSYSLTHLASVVRTTQKVIVQSTLQSWTGKRKRRVRCGMKATLAMTKLPDRKLAAAGTWSQTIQIPDTPAADVDVLGTQTSEQLSASPSWSASASELGAFLHTCSEVCGAVSARNSGSARNTYQSVDGS